MIVSVMVMVIIPVISDRVSDCRAADAAHHRPDWTANNSAADSARDPPGYRTVWVGKSRTSRAADERSSRKT